MKQRIVLLISLVGIGVSLPAQSFEERFRSFRQEAQNNYASFRDKANQQYADQDACSWISHNSFDLAWCKLLYMLENVEEYD